MSDEHFDFEIERRFVLRGQYRGQAVNWDMSAEAFSRLIAQGLIALEGEQAYVPSKPRPALQDEMDEQDLAQGVPGLTRREHEQEQAVWSPPWSGSTSTAKLHQVSCNVAGCGCGNSTLPLRERNGHG